MDHLPFTKQCLPSLPELDESQNWNVHTKTFHPTCTLWRGGAGCASMIGCEIWQHVGMLISLVLIFCYISYQPPVMCRDRAQEVSKEEIGRLSRSIKRGEVDVEYLKAVIFNAFRSGELPKTSSMLPIIARLLHFSPQELQSLSRPSPTQKSSPKPPRRQFSTWFELFEHS